MPFPHFNRLFRSAIFLTILAMGLGACGSAAEEPSLQDRPPNVVFIMADDLGYGDLGVYGQEKIHTPNLDRMAAEGMLFTQFYSGSTVCAPSRSTLMTGKHTGHTYIRGNREIEPIGQEPLPAEIITVAEVLQQAGYQTGGFGKWGLGGPGSEGMPIKQGFDEFFGYLCQRRAHFYYPEFLFHNGERVPLEGNKVVANPPVPGAGHPLQRARYSHDVIAEQALSFIEENQDRPFFLYAAFTIPHASLTVPPEAKEPYLNAQGESIFPEEPYPPGEHYTPQPQPNATLAAMITRLDRDVGRLLDKLKSLGLAENTIVFFTSDNGPHEEGGREPAFFNSNGPLRGIKRDLYEGGIRMPMIVWGPGQVPAGQTSDAIWAMWDILPTLADIAGAEEQVPEDIDGISFWPAIQGLADRQTSHEHLYWEYYGQGTKQAVRMGKWKAVRRPMLTGEIELYNLQQDVDESNNIANEHPEIVEQMEAIMKKAHEPSEIWTVDG